MPLKGNGFTSEGSNSAKIVLPSFLKGSIPTGKNLLPLGANSFL